MPVTEGEFRARAIKAAGKLNQEGTNCAINIIFQVYEKSLGGGMYEPAEGTIYGSFWLLKENKDDPNGGKIHWEFQINALRDAFAWPGEWVNGHWSGDPDWFADHINGQECRITTEWESYEGKNRLRVKWLNPAQGLKPPTPEERQTISALFKQLVAGGPPSTAATPAKPAKAAKPRPPATAAQPKEAAAAAAIRGGATAPPGRAAAAPKKYNYADTKGHLRSWFKPGVDDATLDAAWWRVADAIFPDYSEEQKMALSSEDCAKFILRGKEVVVTAPAAVNDEPAPF